MKFLNKIIALSLLLPSVSAYGQEVNLSHAGVIVSTSIKPKVRETAVRILSEEIGKRTSLKWQRTDS